MINETASSIQKSAFEEIAKCYIDECTLKLGNEGNRTRFTNFLVQLFDSESSQERIKSELIQYFTAVDLAYRSKINSLLKQSELQNKPLLRQSPLRLKADQDTTFGDQEMTPSISKKLHYRPLMDTLTEDVNPIKVKKTTDFKSFLKETLQNDPSTPKFKV